MKPASAVLWLAALFSASPVAAAPAKPIQWIINGPAVAALAGDPGARAYFDGKEPFVVRKDDRPADLPPGWKSRETRTFTSVAHLEAASARGFGAHVRAIIYDNEGWRFTPLDEQRDPVGATKRAAEIAHRHGLLLIAAPAVTLLRNFPTKSHAVKRYDRFLDSGIVGGVARYADAVDVQAQGSEAATSLYRSFVRAAADQARAAHKGVLVFAGISTNPSGQRVTPAQIVRAVTATRAYVDGYWFNIPAPSPYCPSCNDFRPDIALAVLRDPALR